MRLAVDRDEARARDAGAAAGARRSARRWPTRCSRRGPAPTSRRSRRSASGWTRCGSALAGRGDPDAVRLSLAADALVPKSVWIVGGDGWAYDIGFGGLDHVLALGLKVNVLVLDTEVYSNTGGQQSKATPIGAAAKFAVAGKATGKKDLGAMARDLRPRLRRAGRLRRQGRADGARPSSRPRRIPGPSLIIAYSPCIAHGYDLAHGLDQQKLAVDSGYWPLYRFDPRRAAAGERRASSSTPARRRSTLEQFTRNETRFRLVEQQDPERFARAGAAGPGGHPDPVRDARGAGAAGAAPAPAERAGAAPPSRSTDMDLATTYLGLPLAHPLITGASPLVDHLDLVRRLEDAGAAAITMHSLFEEQLADGAPRRRGTPSKRTATATPKRRRTSRSPATSRSGPTSTSSRSVASRRRSGCR